MSFVLITGATVNTARTESLDSGKSRTVVTVRENGHGRKNFWEVFAYFGPVREALESLPAYTPVAITGELQLDIERGDSTGKPHISRALIANNVIALTRPKEI